jgi:hypothetical protein
LLGGKGTIGEEENDEETKAKDGQIKEGASRKRKQRLGNTFALWSQTVPKFQDVADVGISPGMLGSSTVSVLDFASSW